MAKTSPSGAGLERRGRALSEDGGRNVSELMWTASCLVDLWCNQLEKLEAARLSSIAKCQVADINKILQCDTYQWQCQGRAPLGVTAPVCVAL